MSNSARAWSAALACSIAALLGQSTHADAQTWSGPSFWEFTGVNQSGTGNALYSNILSYNRHDVSWSSVEPSNGTWNMTSLNNAKSEIQTLAASGVRLLPVLDYCTNWAADLSSRQWTFGNTKWVIAPGSGGTMVSNKYDIPTGNLLGTQTYVIGSQTLPDFSHFPPASTANWTTYVQTVVSNLTPAPYNVSYFQLWNEAQETSGFWVGSMTDYFQKIHLPGAQAVHAGGGKVVYGGWPESGTMSEFISLLDANSAWSSIDVIDSHYFGTNDAFPTLRSAADSRGYIGMGIWQTEIGFTTDFAYVPSAMTHRLYWALNNNWTQDKYKILYFANSAPNDPKAYGYNCSLYSGSSLSGHGQCMQALGNLLGGKAVLNLFPGVTSSPSYTDTTPSTMENFAVNNTIVNAVNLTTADYTGVSAISFTLPLPRSVITKAERVDIIGNRVDLTSTLVNNGSTTTLPNVAVKDPTGSSARTWNDATANQRVFYTVITLNLPAVSKFEAENLSIIAQTAGVTNSNTSDYYFSNNMGAFFNATAANQYVTYTVPNVAAGTYDVRVGVKKFNNKGAWQLAVSRTDQLGSPTNVGSPVDEYNAASTYNEIDLGSWSPGTTSDKAFKFTVTGKNASSSGYGIAVDYIKLIAL